MREYACLLAALLLFAAGCGDSSTTDITSANDTSNTANVPTLSLVDVSDCKAPVTGIPLVSAPPDQDCMEYWYYGGGTLGLRHVNAGFNCCPVLDFDIRVEGDTITVEEIELEGDCLCLCLFDVELEIENLSPGIYHVVVIEPYRPVNDPVLEFDMDIVSSPSGRHCVSRSDYPWMYF